MSSAARNLANEIRSDGSEAQFDLAGWSLVNAAKLVEEAFSTPIVALSPFRIRFTIGAGRQGRVRYDPELGKQLSASLRSIGYEEDRGATRGSTRSFKHQHDTDKNLVFLHVFPDFEVPQPDSPTGEGGGAWDREGNLSEMYKPEQLCVTCSIDTFQEALERKLPSWSQKKALQMILKEKASLTSNIEVKMTKRESPTEEEMNLYNEAMDLDQKLTLLTKSMKAMVDVGQLTASEKNQVLSQIEARIEEVQLSNEKTRLEERCEKVKAIEPITPPLRNMAEICNLAVKLHDVEKLEAIKGRLLSIDETKKLGAKPELQEKLQGLEEEAVGWFVDQDEVHRRIEQLKKDAISTAIKKRVTSGKMAKKNSSAEWQTVGQHRGPKWGNRHH